MKSFTMAVRENLAAPQPVEFSLPTKDRTGVEVYEATPPSEEHIAFFSAAFGTDAPKKDRMAAVLDFIRGTVTPAGYGVIRERLLDREDDLSFDILVELVSWLMEQFTDFPTQPFSDSTPSRPGTGPRSTGRSRSAASTRSITAPVASAT